MLTGVVEVGLFCHMARAAYFGNQVSGHYFSGTTILTFSQDGSVTVKELVAGQVVEKTVLP